MPDIEWILDVVEAGCVIVSALVSRYRAAANDGGGPVGSVLIFGSAFFTDIKARQVAGVPMTGFQFDDFERARIHLAASAYFHTHSDHAIRVVIGEFGIEGAFFVFER